MNWALVFEAPVAGAWWAFIPAAFAIAVITFSLYMMNTGMDEIFNPKIRS
jgi:peptide/nickel transport system permease protein